MRAARECRGILGRMSKAFTREEVEPPLVVAPRAPLPEGVPNYVTARGLARLREELIGLEAELANAAQEPDGAGREPAQAALVMRRAELEHRIASAELVEPPSEPTDTVRFGATVSIDGAGGLRRYWIVGVDEADPASGRIAFVSPLARALVGRVAGDIVRVRTPRGEEELEIVSVEYERSDSSRVAIPREQPR
jgi:transcription elongation factor GreB